MQNIVITTLSFNRLEQNDFTKSKFYFKFNWLKGERDKKTE